VLARLGDKPETVLPVLLEGLAQRDPAVRSQALAALNFLGPKAAPAVPALIEHLKAANGGNMYELYQVFPRIGPAAVGPLVDLLTAPKADPQMVQAVTLILNTMGPAAGPKVLPLLKHDDPRVRGMACQIVGNSRATPATAVPRLMECLTDADAGVRSQALGALSHFGPDARQAVPKVIPFARDPQPAVRTTCLHTLEAIGADDPTVEPVALAALKDDVNMVRSHALLLLSAANPRHPDLVAEALKLFQGPPANPLGLEVLRRLGPGAAKAVPALAEALRTEPNLHTRTQLASALGAIGPAARAATPALIDLLREREFNTRQVALQALQAIGGADAAKLVPALVIVIREGQDYVRGLALDLLGEQGPAAAEAVPMLLQELARPQWANHLWAARALGKIDPERARKEGAPLLEKWLKAGPDQIRNARAVCLLNPDHKEASTILRRALRSHNPGQWYFRAQAAEAVGDVGARFRDAAPELDDALRDKVPNVRVAAADALWKVSGDAEAVVPVLVELLKPANPPPVRYAALQKLREMGPAAKEARPALRELRADADQYLRQTAGEVVRRLDTTAAVRP
jgi:HEAT repeat protein